MKEQTSISKSRLTIRDIALIGMMTATLEAGKQALAFIPNIEIVSLLIIMYTLFFGKKTVYAIFCFILLEGCLFGFGIWWVMYLYAWPLLALSTWFLRKHASATTYAFLSAIYGLCFGGLCAIPYLFVGGTKMAFSWWIAGIPYDIAHCVGNFALCFLLYRPLHHVLSYIKKESYDVDAKRRF